MFVAPCCPLAFLQYTKAYMGGWAWTIFLVVPQSITVNLAFQTGIGSADTV